MAASMAEYRSVGMTYGIKNVLASLFNDKFPLTEIKSYLKDETVMNTLKKINSDTSLNISVIKAIFILYRRKSTLTAGNLQTYYDFILTDGKTMVDSLYDDIIDADKANQWTEFIDAINVLMYRSKSAASASELSPASEPASASASELSSASEPAPASATAATPSEPSMASTTGSNVTLISASTKPKYSFKAKTPSVASTVSGASGTSTSTDILKGGLTVGYKIHIKDDSLNTDKHKESMLNDINNTHAKLLVIDIESCTDVIYPVAIDLAPESTNKDILDYIVKVLTEATQKNLKCHTNYHVFTVRTWTDSSRVIYISVAK
jgi:hypothetical protein